MVARGGRGRGIRTWWPVAVLCLLAPVRAHAEAPAARCSARLAGGRALVDVELLHFLDPELARVVRLGVEGRLRVEVTLVRERALWFDAPAATQVTELYLRWSKASGRYVLGSWRELEDPGTLALERLSLRPGAPPAPGERYRVDVRAHLQVITAGSLGQVASWIAERKNGAPPVSETVLSAIASDLARQASCACAAVASP